MLEEKRTRPEGVLRQNDPFREQLTLIRIFEELRGRGYDGGYDAVRGEFRSSRVPTSLG